MFRHVKHAGIALQRGQSQLTGSVWRAVSTAG